MMMMINIIIIIIMIIIMGSVVSLDCRRLLRHD